MPDLTTLIARGDVCRCLRAKTMFYQVEPVAGEEPSALEGPFWCLRTQSALGPDGNVADAEQCRPGRGCCETA
jgi:hypothetical protein